METKPRSRFVKHESKNDLKLKNISDFMAANIGKHVRCQFREQPINTHLSERDGTIVQLKNKEIGFEGVKFIHKPQIIHIRLISDAELNRKIKTAADYIREAAKAADLLMMNHIREYRREIEDEDVKPYPPTIERLGETDYYSIYIPTMLRKAVGVRYRSLSGIRIDLTIRIEGTMYNCQLV